MRYLVSIIVVFIFFGCSSKVIEEDLIQLNGYWEIERVTFADGQTKDFIINPNIDYIQLENLKGFRKKMQPKFNGSYTTSNDTEFFTIENNNESFEFHYKNEMSEWSEQIISITKDRFSVINQDTLTYMYKRFQPINATE